MFHLQALHARSDATFEILRTSQAFFLPEKGADPQTITTYAKSGGRLSVRLVAETHPGGDPRRPSLATTLRRRGTI